MSIFFILLLHSCIFHSTRYSPLVGEQNQNGMRRLHMTSSGHRTPDPLFVSSVPYPLGHMLQLVMRFMIHVRRYIMSFSLIPQNTDKDIYDVFHKDSRS